MRRELIIRVQGRQGYVLPVCSTYLVYTTYSLDPLLAGSPSLCLSVSLQGTMSGGWEIRDRGGRAWLVNWDTQGMDKQPAMGAKAGAVQNMATGRTLTLTRAHTCTNREYSTRSQQIQAETEKQREAWNESRQ